MSASPVREIKSLAELPFTRDASPFKMKGVAYLHNARFLPQVIPGGTAEVLRFAGQADLGAFFAQTFLAGAMYDVFPMVLLHQHSARLRNVSFLKHVTEACASQVEFDLGGVYAMLLKVVSPQLLMKQIVRVNNQYFNFGGTAMEEVGPGHARYRQQGVPEVAAPWFNGILDGYVKHAVMRAGAKEVQTRFDWQPTGHAAHGLELANLTADVAWK